MLIELLNTDMSGFEGDFAEAMADILIENGVTIRPPADREDELKKLRKILNTDVSEIELKPCPFCGGEAEIYIRAEFINSPFVLNTTNAYGVR